jgi:AmmeMemoRadiSam system protein A
MSVIAAFIVPHPPLIIPEVGKGEEEQISRTVKAYLEAMKQAAELKPDTIVISSPHSVCYYDYFHVSPGFSAQGDFHQFGAKQIKIRTDYDEEFSSALSQLCQEKDIPAGTMGEKSKELDHGTMIPLYFLQKYLPTTRIVRIGLSGLPPINNYHLGQAIQQTAEKLNRRVVYIASGDLSHVLKADGPYGYKKEGPVFDSQITQQMAKADFLSFFKYDPAFLESAAECGLGSFQIMAGALDQKAVKPVLLSYEGPFGVGYGVASFIVEGDDPKRNFDVQFEAEKKAKQEEIKAKEDPYVKLARLAVETFVTTGQTAKVPSNLPGALLSSTAGAFVSLHKDGELRGCIGTFAPTRDNLALEIIYNGISACSEDPRFEAVKPNELEDLVYSVDVLTAPVKIFSPTELDPKKYGVIVEKGYKRGLLLPNLDGVDTIEEQISIAKRKANINPDETVTLYRFESVRHL